MLAPAQAADPAYRRRFIAESRAAAVVDDPHIIPVYEAGEASGVLFIAMRFVPGGDLRSGAGPVAPGSSCGGSPSFRRVADQACGYDQMYEQSFR